MYARPCAHIELNKLMPLCTKKKKQKQNNNKVGVLKNIKTLKKKQPKNT
jgi:hypothetical protein